MDTVALISPDEAHEQALVRSLLEFGLREWYDGKLVADYLLNEFVSSNLEELIDNKQLINLILIYKDWYQNGHQPVARHFLYHPDPEISHLAIQIMDFKHEISPNWNKFYEGKIESREDLYKEEVLSTLNYLKLRKVKRMIDQNQRDLENTRDDQEMLEFLKTHQILKKTEIELTAHIGTVIIK
jgi:DNA primase